MRLDKVTQEVEHCLTSLTFRPFDLSFCLLKYSMDPFRLFSASDMHTLGHKKLRPSVHGLNMYPMQKHRGHGQYWNKSSLKQLTMYWKSSFEM